MKYVTDSDGNRNGVILSVAEYEELMEDVEDVKDLGVVAERRNESAVPHEQLLAELRRDGLLPD